jgi:toxin secretion/phage lysis holin
MTFIKEIVCTVLGIIGTFFAGLLGGWDTSIAVLLSCMAADYIMGVIIAIEKKSLKTPTGGLSSAVGFKGLVKKGVIVLLVFVATQLDAVLDTSYIRDAVCIAFISNELISILENAGLLGVPLPTVMLNIIEILQKKTESKTTENGKEDNESNSEAR